MLKLVASSAVLCGRDAARVSDLWVLRYVWDRIEQIGPLTALVSGMLERTEGEAAHPRSARAERIDPEELARELSAAEAELVPGLKLVETARLRERLQSVADRAAWVQNSTHRDHLLAKAASLLEKLG
jgi:MoxR-like ATPase